MRHGPTELTKLLNRKYFFEVLNQEFEANQEGSLALAIINIDDFKLYNQLYGTQAGDNALRRIAEIIKSSVGDSGYAARYSGKEFAVLLPKYDVFSAQNLVKSIQRQIFQMTDTTVDYKLKVLTVSVGISAAPYAAKTAKELLGQCGYGRESRQADREERESRSSTPSSGKTLYGKM